MANYTLIIQCNDSYPVNDSPRTLFLVRLASLISKTIDVEVGEDDLYVRAIEGDDMEIVVSTDNISLQVMTDIIKLAASTEEIEVTVAPEEVKVLTSDGL